MVVNPGWVGCSVMMDLHEGIVNIIMNFHMQFPVLRSDMMATAGRRNLKVHDEEIKLKKNSFELCVSESANDRDAFTP